MAEWIIERGIGEDRAALIADGRILAALLDRASDGLRAGAVVDARLIDRAQRLAKADTGEELFVPRWPAEPEGARLRFVVRRSALPEAGNSKRAVASLVDAATPLTNAPDIAARAAASGLPVHEAQPGTRPLADAGWEELLDEAASGIVAFTGGLLRISLTPAMTVIDVDGDLPAPALAHAAVAALAATLRRQAIGGNIVIDLPTLPDAAARKAVAAAFDSAMAGQPFERTAINGFGLLQLILPREAPSLPERMRFAPVESAALALLRRATNAVGAGPLTLAAHPAVIAWLEAHPALLTELARRTGRPPHLQVDAALAMDAGHAQ